jgi:hypothetical protein
MHLSKSYSFKNKLDLEKLFELSDITDDVNERIKSLELDIEECFETLKSKNEIDIEVGSHCDSSYPCDFKEYCWPEIKEDNITLHFPAGKQKKLLNQEIKSILDINDKTTGLDAKDKILVNSFQKKEIFVNKDGIRNFIEQLKYPIYHLDYETFAPAVPFLESIGCYKPQVPFQFSIHVQASEDTEVKHFEFLHEKIGYPRREIAEAVIKCCGDQGTILAYNMSFEKSVNT